jgi:hypothetical protein
MRRSPVGPEVVDLGAEAEDEEVVAQRLEFVEANLSRLEVDAGDGRLMDDRVVLVPDQIAEGMPYGRRLEQAGRELVEKWLKVW